MADETETQEGPIDFGDGKPAVSLPPGSFDGDKLAVVLEEVDHDDPVALTEALLSCRTDVVEEAKVTLSETGSNGYYEISASWLEEPIRVRGKANAEAEAARLEAEGPPPPVEAPVIPSVTAPEPNDPVTGAELNPDPDPVTEGEDV